MYFLFNACSKGKEKAFQNRSRGFAGAPLVLVCATLGSCLFVGCKGSVREENLTLNWPRPGQFNVSWTTGQEHHGTRKRLGSSKGKPSPAAQRILLASQKVCKMPRARWNHFNTEASPTSLSWRDYPRHSCKGQAIKNKQAISNKAFPMLPFCEIRLCWRWCEVSFYGNLASLNYKWSCCGEASPLWFLNELYC